LGLVHVPAKTSIFLKLGLQTSNPQSAKGGEKIKIKLTLTMILSSLAPKTRFVLGRNLTTEQWGKRLIFMSYALHP